RRSAARIVGDHHGIVADARPLHHGAEGLWRGQRVAARTLASWRREFGFEIHKRSAWNVRFLILSATTCGFGEIPAHIDHAHQRVGYMVVKPFGGNKRGIERCHSCTPLSKANTRGSA